MIVGFNAVLEGKQLRENKAAETKKISKITAEDAGVTAEEAKVEE